MAEGDGILYDEFKYRVLSGEYDMSNAGNTLKLALFSSSYVPAQDTDTTYTALTNECSGVGYTAGGEILANQTITKDTANHRSIYDADDVTWTSIGTLSPQPAWAVLYDDTNANKYLIGYWEIATPTNGGNWTIQFASGPDAVLMIT